MEISLHWHRPRASGQRRATILAGMIACWLFLAAGAPADLLPVYLYKLSDFNGPIHLNWIRLGMDRIHDEIYLANTRTGEISVFNDKGMEIYSFGEDGSLGAVIDVAVESSGRILVLTRIEGNPVILVCDFKGQPLSRLALKDLPPEFSSVSPDSIIFRHDLIYLMDKSTLRVVVTDARGGFLLGRDIGRLLQISGEKRSSTQIGGFSVDAEGNIYFTIPVLFTAYRLAPDGTISGFGRPGSAPGRFGVIGGIAADDEGNIYIADRLKSVVLIFDKYFKFQMEFGYRGNQAENLIAPDEVDLDRLNRLYVSQFDHRGVSVFKISSK